MNYLNFEKDLCNLPTTFTHDEHNHECGCVKCYFTAIVNIHRVDLIWIIEYILLLTIFNSQSNKLGSCCPIESISPRSPPLL